MKIICGNPEEDKEDQQGATSSFFILPFCYKLHLHTESSSPKLYYEEIKKNLNPEQWVERKRYFTRETASVLFESSHRFRINETAWQDSDLPSSYQLLAHNESKYSRKKTFKIRLSSPEIILFEPLYDVINASDNSRLMKTGFLIVKTYFEKPTEDNPHQPTFADLLLFNERFRYSRRRFDKHLQKEIAPFFLYPALSLSDNKSPFKRYPHPVRIESYQALDKLISAFKASGINLLLRRWQRLLQLPFRFNDFCPERYYKFIETDWIEEAEQWFQKESSLKGNDSKQSGWITYSDNRCFVWTHAMTEGGLSDLKPFVDDNLVTKPESSGHWVKLLNVDPPYGDDRDISRTTEFERERYQPRTYKRWAHENSLYGFNYHSGVCLSPKTYFPLSKTFRRHYFDMILMLLYLRISIFRISNRLSELTRKIQQMNIRNGEQEFLSLRKEFAYFTNLYQFPLISNQQQMVEMYQIARCQLDIDDLFKEVKEEIKNTHEYFSIENSNKLNKIMTFIAWIGLSIAIIGLFLTALPLIQ